MNVKRMMELDVLLTVMCNNSATECVVIKQSSKSFMRNLILMHFQVVYIYSPFVLVFENLLDACNAP